MRNRYRRLSDRLERRRPAPSPSATVAAVVAADPALTVQTFHRRAVVARRRRPQRIVDIMESNRRIAVGCLETAGVRYSVMPIESNNRYRLAISADDRDRLFTALRERAKESAYVFFDLRDLPEERRVVRCRDLPRHPRDLGGDRLAATTIRIFEFYGEDPAFDSNIHGCEVELWKVEYDRQRQVEQLRAPHWNRAATLVDDELFGSARGLESAGEYAITPGTVGCLMPNDVPFPVDLVYTWVDGTDPAWQARKEAAHKAHLTDEHHREAANKARFDSKDELRYSLRSVEQYADFFRHIYLVVDGQRPEWLVAEHPRLTIVDHRDIMPPEILPVFNSHAIEAHLHRIPQLADHYVYMNDDFFLCRRLRANTFFEFNGLAKFFPSRANIPLGEPTSDTKPVDTAAINSRTLVQREFGLTVTTKFKHAPYAQRRDVHDEIWKRFPDEAERTARSPFRSPTDLACASSLHHHVGYALGRATPGNIASNYVDLGSRNLEGQLRRLLEVRDYDALCLNDNESDEISPKRQARLTREFLEALFPVPSSFER